MSRIEMDSLEHAYYEGRFENRYLRARGDEFQALFEELMGRVYKADFMACRPWGNRGDRKNDGFLKSERRLFQVYAPNEMTEAQAIKKIRSDFKGAKMHWRKHFDSWVFVHNAYDGLPPHVQKEILELKRENEGVDIIPWGFEELKTVFKRLTRGDLESWFGFAPTATTRNRLGFEDLRVVLETIAAARVHVSSPIRDVPPRKIEANALSESIARLLKEGMAKSPLVTEFFGKWHDPAFGERVASAFRIKYQSLRDDPATTFTANEIFYEVQSWAGGAERGSAEHELAVLTVLAYYFERCDIFEEPPQSQS